MPTSLWLFSALLAMSAMKKSRGSTAEAAEYMAKNARTSESCWAAVNRPLSSGGGLVYDMDDEIDRIRLEYDIWVKDPRDSLDELPAANFELVAVLESSISNQSKVTELFIDNKKRLVDGILLNICRAQSQKKMPLLTAALSVLEEANQVPAAFHDVLTTYFKGALASKNWTKDFIVRARDRRPPPSAEPLEGVAVVAFDNLTMNVNYESYVREGEGGYKLDMTNWFSTQIPRTLAGAQFDARIKFKEGIFRNDLSLDKFSRSFYLNEPDIVANQRKRWVDFLKAALRMDVCWIDRILSRCGSRTKYIRSRCLTVCSRLTLMWSMS